MPGHTTGAEDMHRTIIEHAAANRLVDRDAGDLVHIHFCGLPVDEAALEEDCPFRSRRSQVVSGRTNPVRG